MKRLDADDRKPVLHGWKQSRTESTDSSLRLAGSDPSSLTNRRRSTERGALRRLRQLCTIPTEGVLSFCGPFSSFDLFDRSQYYSGLALLSAKSRSYARFARIRMTAAAISATSHSPPTLARSASCVENNRLARAFPSPVPRRSTAAGSPAADRTPPVRRPAC